jgi:hypothetical protein
MYYIFLILYKYFLKYFCKEVNLLKFNDIWSRCQMLLKCMIFMSERKLIRLPGFNYAVSRYYFFTICVKGHTHSLEFAETNTCIFQIMEL